MVKPVLSAKRQRTRSALIEATLAIISEQGFSAVSLNAVAARVGVSKGSVYSNFRGKAELLWAAAGQKAWYVVPRTRPGASLHELAGGIAAALMQVMPQAEREAEFYRQLQAYIASDPELAALQAEQQKRLFDAIAQGLEAELGDRLVLPARTLSLGVQGLIRGFAAQWARTPDEVTEDIVAANFEALLTGATTPVAPRDQAPARAGSRE